MTKKIKHFHNKKRNTGFLYEACIRKLTRLVIEKNEIEKRQMLDLLKKHFSHTILDKEVEVYKVLNEIHDVVSTPKDAKIVLFEALNFYGKLNHKKIFQAQNNFLKDLNEVFPDVFDEQVASYRKLASIYQILSPSTPFKKRMVLQEELVNDIENKKLNESTIAEVDSLILKKFVEKYNTKYYKKLLPEQKKLVSEFTIHGVDSTRFKLALNEAIESAKTNLKESYEIYKTNPDLKLKSEQILEAVNGFAQKPIDEKLFMAALQVQELVAELKSECE